MALGSLDSCVWLTSFQKIDTGWPQESPTERVSGISEKLDFWWSIPKKGTGIGHLGARDDQTIIINWSNEAVEVIGDHWDYRSFMAWKITTEDFRVIYVFEFSFIFIFWKKGFFLVESWFEF